MSLPLALLSLLSSNPPDGEPLATRKPSAPIVLQAEDSKRRDQPADATLLFQAALKNMGASGGKILVPRGTYTFATDTPINLPSGVSIECATGAVLQKTSGKSTIFKTQDVSYVYITGGEWIGPSNQASFLWQANGTQHFGMLGLKVRNFASGMLVGEKSKCSDLTVSGCTFEHNTLAGLSIPEVTDLEITNNTFEANGTESEPGRTHGIYLITTTNVVIKNNIFTNNVAFGIHLYVSHQERKGASNVSVSGNFFFANGANLRNGGGIIVSGKNPASGIHIFKNQSTGDWNGIVILSASNYQIENNTIINPLNNGIYVGEELDPAHNIHGSVTGNTITGCGGDGIQLGLSPNVRNIILQNNTIDHSGAGINIRKGYGIPKFISISGNKVQNTANGMSYHPDLRPVK